METTNKDLDMNALDESTRKALVEALETRFIVRSFQVTEMVKHGELSDFNAADISTYPEDMVKIKELTHLIATPVEITGFVNAARDVISHSETKSTNE